MMILLTKKCNGFGYTGHYIIGQTVWSLLNESTKRILQDGPCDFMLGRSLGNLSTWADEIKKQGRYRWTSPIHYYDISNNPPVECGKLTLPIIKPKLNLINGIIASTAMLRDWQKRNGSTSGICDEQVAFNFRMLLHILQDMHQPLHLTGKDRGGNDATVRLRGRKHTLHSLWDSTLIDWHLKERYGGDHRNDGNGEGDGDVRDAMAADLVVELLPKIKIGFCNSTDEMTFTGWADESVQSNCDIVYRFETMPEPDYIHTSNATIIDAMSKAAIRSACHLNFVFRV